MSTPPRESAPSSSGSANFFASASGVRVKDSTFVAIGTYAAERQDDVYRYLENLYNLVSPNAIMNAGGRADPVHCYPGTREEVMTRIEAWRTSGYISDRKIFWLSGPAGAGKSAIVQTLAERYIHDQIPMANFFFFRADGSRNIAQPVVPTLLSQLLAIYPSLRSRIGNVIRDNPIILRTALLTQFRGLILNPLRELQSNQEITQPIVLLVDGLDECESKDDQSTLLRILDQVVHDDNSPFIALVASRPESHITMAFNALGTFHDSIFLDDTYRPSADIRLFVHAELTKIGETHPLRHFLTRDWPSDDLVDQIVMKSSGQFIYAATVVRFVANASSSPHSSIQTILGIRPAGKRTPFAELDAVYRHIFSQVEDWDLVHDVLAIQKIFKKPKPSCFIMTYFACELLGYEREDVEAALLDLISIILCRNKIDTHGSDLGFELEFYHASLDDFLEDKTRAGSFYVDLHATASKILPPYLPLFMTWRFGITADLVCAIKSPSDEISEVLSTMNLPQVHPNGAHYRDDDAARFLQAVKRLYAETNPDLCEIITCRWVRCLRALGASIEGYHDAPSVSRESVCDDA